jgi:hypothetical protein
MDELTAQRNLVTHMNHTIYDFLKEHPPETFNDDVKMWHAFVAFQVKELERAAK